MRASTEGAARDAGENWETMAEILDGSENVEPSEGGCFAVAFSAIDRVDARARGQLEKHGRKVLRRTRREQPKLWRREDDAGVRGFMRRRVGQIDDLGAEALCSFTTKPPDVTSPRRGGK